MARAIARHIAHIPDHADALRMAIVCGCAMALILAGNALPL